MQGLIKYSEVDGELKELILPEQGYDAQKFSLDDERTMLCTHDKVLDDRYFVEPDAKIFYIPANYIKIKYFLKKIKFS